MSMIEEYQRAGFTCIEGLFNKEEVLDLQLATDELIEQSRSHITSDEKFDLEHNHSSQNPRVQNKVLTNNTLFLQRLSENLRF